MCRLLFLLISISFLWGAVGCKSATSSSSSGSSSDSTSAKTVTLGTQTGTLTAGTAGSATFAVSTSNVSSGTTGTIMWYTSSAGTTVSSTPTGITATVLAVASNSACVTILVSTAALAGSYYFKLTEGSAVSAVGTVTVSSSVSKWSTWFDTTKLSSTAPVSLSYNDTTDVASVTVSSVAGAEYIWNINACYQIGSVNKATYILSFTAWTDSGTYVISPRLQQSGGNYTTFDPLDSSNISLTTTPTVYSLTSNVSIAGNAQAIFNCAQQTGTFHIKGITVSAAPMTSLATPSISSISYDSNIAKTTIAFPSISGAEYVYLYESNENDPTTATLLGSANQSQSYWRLNTRKEIEAVFDNAGSSVIGFTVTGYSATGSYYYWISGQKAAESESNKSSAASVAVSGNFSNYSYVPTDADCRAISDNWFYTITSTGADTPQFFYAASGMTVTISGNSSDSAKVGIKVYLAAATPSYVIGSATAYDSSWQSTSKSFTAPASGYYVIDRNNLTVGSYELSIGSTSVTAAKILATSLTARTTGLKGTLRMLNRH